MIIRPTDYALELAALAQVARCHPWWVEPAEAWVVLRVTRGLEQAHALGWLASADDYSHPPGHRAYRLTEAGQRRRRRLGGSWGQVRGAA